MTPLELVALFAACALFAAILLCKLATDAPEGWQDAEGFHFGRSDHDEGNSW